MLKVTVSEFPNCCTAKIFSGFGGTQTGARSPREHDDPATLSMVVSSYMKAQATAGRGIMVAMLTTEQTVAIDVLTKLGWNKSCESEKNNHSETRLICMTWACKTDGEVTKVVNPFAPPKADKLPFDLFMQSL